MPAKPKPKQKPGFLDSVKKLYPAFDAASRSKTAMAKKKKKK